MLPVLRFYCPLARSLSSITHKPQLFVDGTLHNDHNYPVALSEQESQFAYGCCIGAAGMEIAAGRRIATSGTEPLR